MHIDKERIKMNFKNCMKGTFQETFILNSVVQGSRT